jgi:transcriptional regulator GlxA family with amidase domain
LLTKEPGRRDLKKYLGANRIRRPPRSRSVLGMHRQFPWWPIDTLIAIGGEGAVAPHSPELSKWLRERAAHTRRLASICTGAFLLASAGLLDGHRVATHWQWCDLLQSRYKQLKVERDPIFIKEGKIYTTAGVTAGIDLSLALVEEDLGHAAAAAIARTLVLFLRRPGGQAQYSTLLAQQEGIEDVRMRDLPVWVRANLSRKLDVDKLANAAAMSPRTFVRQFKAQFNTTPARWVQSLRVEAAMQHLADRNKSVDWSRVVRVFASVANGHSTCGLDSTARSGRQNLD